MGNVVCQSCWHPHAKLHFVDKAINLGLGCMLPLSGVSKHQEESKRLEMLSACRASHAKMNSSYARQVQDTWRLEERALPRLCGQGEPIQVAIHVPRSHAASVAPEDLPLIIWAHGGCMTLGTRHDSWGSGFMKNLAAKLGPFCWASVEYRLAPEHKFPAAIDDCVSAHQALADPAMAREFGYSPSKICLVGVSAGSLVVGHAALRLADPKIPLALLYPMAEPKMNGKSHELYGGLPSCPSSFLRLSWDWLLSNGGQAVSAERLAEASLVEADWSKLRGGKAVCLLARYDSLYDEGRALVDHATKLGVEMKTVESEGSHAVAHMVDKEAQEQLFRAFSELLAEFTT